LKITPKEIGGLLLQLVGSVHLRNLLGCSVHLLPLLDSVGSVLPRLLLSEVLVHLVHQLVVDCLVAPVLLRQRFLMVEHPHLQLVVVYSVRHQHLPRLVVQRQHSVQRRLPPPLVVSVHPRLHQAAFSDLRIPVHLVLLQLVGGFLEVLPPLRSVLQHQQEVVCLAVRHQRQRHSVHQRSQGDSLVNQHLHHLALVDLDQHLADQACLDLPLLHQLLVHLAVVLVALVVLLDLHRMVKRRLLGLVWPLNLLLVNLFLVTSNSL
jgi:hypothetical protein